MAKIDNKARLRQSLISESASVNKRFFNADKEMASHPNGLAGEKIAEPIPPAAPNLRAEIGKDQNSNNLNKIIRVPIDHAHDNPFNARHIYDAESIKSMAASVATRGQLVPAPAALHPTRPGHVILIDGHYRKRALQAAGKEEIDVVLHHVTNDLDMYRLSYQINEERHAQSPLDNALSWTRLLEAGTVANGEAIAEMTGLSAAAVTKTMALLKLPESAIARIRENPNKFGVAIGYEIYRCSKLLDERALLNLMEKVVAEDISSRDIDQMRAKLEQGSQRKQKEVSRQYKIKVGDVQIGFIKDWDAGKVAFEVHLTDPKEREALVDELKKRFNLGDGAER
jgi:ParB family chromosome partitioning protein